MSECLRCKEQERIGALNKIGIEHRVQLLDELVLLRKRVDALEKLSKPESGSWAEECLVKSAHLLALSVSFSNLLAEFGKVCFGNVKAAKAFDSATDWNEHQKGVWVAP